MTYDEFKTSLKPFKAVLVLDDIVSHRKRILLRDIFGTLTLILIALIVALNLNLAPNLSVLLPYSLKMRGFLLIFLALDIIFFMLECFFYSFYERSLEENISFALARLLYVGSSEDLTFSFFSSYIGWQVTDRLGILPDAMNNFLGSRKQNIPLNQLSLSFASGQRQDVSTFIKALYESDLDLSSFFFSLGIQKEEVVATAFWVRKEYMALDRQKDADKIRQLRTTPDYIINSVQAITKRGEAVVASNTGSQIGADASGAGEVIWVVGVNKIVDNLSDAFTRINEYVLPLESERLKKLFGVGSMVSQLLIITRSAKPGRITVIFVNEKLGY